LQPLAADFAQIARIDGPAALGRFHARLSLALGGSPLVNLAVGTDRKDSSRMALYVDSGALPLRRDEYLEPASAGVRALYQAHVASMLRAAATQQSRPISRRERCWPWKPRWPAANSRRCRPATPGSPTTR
jgi:predicted metalloendopeptidase